MKRLILLSTVILFLGAGCAWSSTTPAAPQGALQVPGSPQPSEQTIPSGPTGPARVQVDSTEQSVARVLSQPAGPEVNAAYVRLAKQGYIAVRADAGGAPGNVIGTSQRLFAGENTDVPIYAKTATGTTYWAALYLDDGDGIFNASKDAIAKDSKGNLVQFTFKTLDQ